MQVIRNRIQIVELLRNNRPGRVAEELFRKCRNFVADDRLRIGGDQILERDNLSVRSEHMRFPFTKRGLLRSGVDDARHDRNGATHPEFIETGPTHVVRIVRSRIKAKALTWGTKCPAGVAMEKLKDSAVLVETVIKNRSDAVAGSIDHILSGILVQFICENRGCTSHEHCLSESKRNVWVPKHSGMTKDNAFAEKFTRRANGFEQDNLLQESRVKRYGRERSDFDCVLNLRRGSRRTRQSLTAKRKQLAPIYLSELYVIQVGMTEFEP